MPKLSHCLPSKRLFRPAVLLLALIISTAAVLCIPSRAGTATQTWCLGSTWTLSVTEGCTTLQGSGGQTAVFDGSLLAACREDTLGTLCLLLQRSDGLYGGFFDPADPKAVPTSTPLPKELDPSVWEAGIDPATFDLYLHVRTAQGAECFYLVQEDETGTHCAAADASTAIWNSTTAVPEPSAETSQESSGSSIEPDTPPASASPSSAAESASSLPSLASEAESSDAASLPQADSSANNPSAPESTAEPTEIYRCSDPVTVAEFEQLFLTTRSRTSSRQEQFQFTTAKGVPISTGSLTTGDIVQEIHDGTIRRFQLVIPGDLCGSGRPDKASYQALRNCVAGSEPLTGLAALAADMTAPAGYVAADTVPVLTTADLLLLKRAGGL